ncbi:response regulator transcription factor [Fusibacter ferrireducens]|uniref:Stage 0 sporulation protein A homolog n=1 Tax=Fusibacter ferrireducens TaxID=2785058 RepID=A0ABR9ZYH2_9FIRM|nr:response regulator transcription factor [Fusibacter ferrireducens]MBF4694624.1 response regulator transcription factor [Fusibacter ferrireducens]
MQKKIYVADDEKNIRELIMSFLKNDGFEVKTFEDGKALYDAFLMDPADMLIIDIMMPEMDGLSLCTKIREKHNVPIIIVSARDSELDRITGITIGSDDYLVKPFSPIELVARVKAIFRRMQFDQGNYEVNPLLSYGDLTISVDKRVVHCKEVPLDLTPTEFALMVYLFEHQERAISREELLKNVWKFDFDVDTRATDDVVKRLRKKLSCSNVKIGAVWGFGFKLEIEDSFKGK